MEASNNTPRVVVTGMGAINGQGSNLDEYWEGVKGGRVAIREVKHLPMEGYRTKIGGEVQVEAPPNADTLHPGGFHDRAIDFTVRAAEEAMDRCGVGVGPVPPERWGVVIGTCNAGLLAGEEWYRKRKNGEQADPKLLLLLEPQAMSETLSCVFGIKGPALSVDTACAASANAIGYGAELIRLGHVDAVLTGGADAFSDILVAGFNSLESLSPEPAAPYSIDRQGLSLGEGSGMLVLMSKEVAEEQGAPILAEIAGYGLSADGYHPTAPHPEGKGAARAIQMGLRQAGISSDQVDYVNSHGTGTAKNDTAETAATKAGLGEEAAYNVAVSSTKSMIGHLLGGAGAVEAIVTVKAIQDQVAPPTANFTEPDPECDLDYVPNEAREMKIDVAVSNNFAFGGANASVAFLRPGLRDEPPPPVDADRTVVTGIGALTTAGTDLDALWQAYASERETTASENGARVGRVELTAGDFLSPKERKRVDRLGLFSIISSKLALEDGGVEVNDDNRNRIGVILGTGVGPMESMEQFAAGVIEEGAGGANPAVFPNTVYNAAGGQVALKVGLLGSATTVTAGHAAGASSLVYAADLTSRDHADAIIALGCDTLTDTVIEGYKELGVVGDGGFALSEAGVALMVERLGKAGGRGAQIYGEIAGYGITSDAKGVGRIDPEGEGIERAMRTALERAGVEPGEVVAVWANRCGLEVADQAEARAIERALGADVKVLGPKLKLGEPMGAGASISAALAMKGWQEGDEERSPKGPVLVNALSLGGTNFSVLLRPIE
ncbi:MAG TPA: beta-ketoacyl-[acyl-carrier-protein] synthase family protein [Thermoleophilaceae bacterium]|nr:beta-ketoacyl-[acyl-carrier-protein] synthase family protein [Thermoleophilaceae bacterium]